MSENLLMELTEDQWEFIQKHLSKNEVRQKRKDHSFTDPRDILESILWISRVGARWQDTWNRFLPYQTCNCCYQTWDWQGNLEKILQGVAEGLLRRKNWIQPWPTSMEHWVRQKSGPLIGTTKRSKGSKIIAMADHRSLAISVQI